MIYTDQPPEGAQEKEILLHIRSVFGQVHRKISTHKVIPRSQSVLPILLKQALEERPGCAGRTRTQRQWLVEDVVIHFMCVPAIEWWLGYERKGK